MRSPSQPTGQWIRKDKRLAIYLRDAFTCLACGRDLRDADPADIALDHIRPKADGGSNKETNLYTCCRSCNCSRQDKPLSRWASPEARAHINRNRARKLTRYLAMARSLIAGQSNEGTSAL